MILLLAVREKGAHDQGREPSDAFIEVESMRPKGKEAHALKMIWGRSARDGCRSRSRPLSFMALFALFGITLLVAGCIGQGVRFRSAFPHQSLTLEGFLYRPKGSGPFPALVLLHTCAGLREHVFDWAEKLVAEGYVALAVDSFSPRGIRTCGPGRPGHAAVAADAFGALVYLRSLPFVDRDRVGVMGWSFGATAALMAGSELGAFLQPPEGGFRAAVAFYPYCTGYLGDETVPLLLLLGELDDWTPASDCVARAEELRQEGQTVVWKVYPGAYHSFDEAELRRYSGTAIVQGHILEYDPEATADAWKRVRAFLAQHLRRLPPKGKGASDRRHGPFQSMEAFRPASARPRKFSLSLFSYLFQERRRAWPLDPGNA